MQYEPLSKIFYKNNPEYGKIYIERFNSESAHRYNFMIGKHQAFVLINLEILNLITRIMQLDRRLLKVSDLFPPIGLDQFTRKCIIDEIQLTNEIEGVHSTRKEIRELIYNTANKKRRRLYGLVQKYMMLTNGQKINLKTSHDIRTLYDEFILEEIKTDDAGNLPDGAIFRKDIVEVVSPSQKVIHKGVYPESEIISSMDSALDILNDPDLNIFVNIAVFHYMFGYIHPFYDGNGRMARFISSYLLNQYLEPMVGFGLSYTIKNEIKKYYDMFKETNDFKNKGDLTPFVIQFLEFIAEAIENLCVTMEGKLEQFEFYVNKIDKYADDNEPIAKLLFVLLQNALFEDEGISIGELAQAARMGESTVRNWLKKMPEEIMTISQSSKMKHYSVNLDVLGAK